MVYGSLVQNILSEVVVIKECYIAQSWMPSAINHSLITTTERQIFWTTA